MFCDNENNDGQASKIIRLALYSLPYLIPINSNRKSLALSTYFCYIVYMQVIDLKEFLTNITQYLPPPEDGLEVTYNEGKSRFFMYPQATNYISDKTNQLANLIVSKIEPKLMNLKNFPIGTLVSVPHVKCSRCDELAEKRVWVKDTKTDKIFVLYLCEPHLSEVDANPRFKMSENLEAIKN